VLLALLAVMAAAACGAGGEQGAAPTGPRGALALAYEPPAPAAGQPVTWVLTVSNGGDEALTLTFSSGKHGDVALAGADGREVYRWSNDRFFTEAVSRQEVAPGEEVAYRLEEPALAVEPGEYDLVATLAAEPEIGPVRQRVRVQ
jgi:hypothetical protein